MASLTDQPAGRARPKGLGTALRILGSALLFATGAIHLDLFLTGYRHIPTIGTLFLLQVISAFTLALLALAFSRGIVALAGAAFALSTLAGYILSLWFGLFGFNEIRTTAGVVAGIVEVATFVVLSSYALFLAPEKSSKRIQTAGRRSFGALSALAMLALVLAVANSPEMTSGPTVTEANAGSVSTTTINISIKSFAFMPSTFTVAPGASIVVTNHDSVTHTFTAMPGSHPQGTFNSGDIAPGKTVTITAPKKPGSYAYYCAIHNYMIGTLIVK